MITAVLRLQQRRRTGAAITFGLAIIALAGIIALFFRTNIVERARIDHIIQVVIPPPPPPPPPPEVKPPPQQPTPIQQPTQAPPEANDAATAQAGTTSNNFGLQVGNGGGLRIGGSPGNGDAARAYGALVTRELQRTLQQDRDLANANYMIRIAVTVSSDGVVQAVRFIVSSGNARRDAAIERLFVGVHLERAPPANLPNFLIAYQSRSGA